MNRLVLFVTALGVSALAVYAVATSDDSDEEIATASVPERAGGTPPVLVALPQPLKKAMPSDFPSLAREIQRELRRVGCYRGEINGLWTPSTRTAMKAFVDDANAVLPVDKPDQVLLSLLQGEHGTACGPSCPPGQLQSPDGACIASSVANNSATITGSVEREPAPHQEQTAYPSAPPSSPSEYEPASAPRAPDTYPAVPASEPSPPLETAALDAAPYSATEGDVLPPPAAYPAKPRRTSSYSRNRPPKVVRSLIRNIKRGLASFGIR